MRGSLLLFVTATLTSVLSALPFVIAAEVAFVPLGSSVSEIRDISSDGSTFVGTLRGSPIEAFVGKLGEEPTRLGLELSTRGTIGYAISDDGTVAAGTILDGYPDRSAFSWSSTSQMVRIEGGNGVTLDSVEGLSFHGDFIVGRMKVPGLPNYSAYRWTEATGAVNLGDLPGGNFDSEAVGVSADGSVVVGNSGTEVPGGYAPFRWTAEGGMTPLDGYFATAFAISSDGSTIVGQSRPSPSFGQPDQAAIWKVGEEVRLLGLLPLGTFSTATDASFSGEVIVGVGNAGERYGAAFRWTEKSGMRSVADLLRAGGVDLTGWRLTSATAVSDDGTVIIGKGMNPSGHGEAFIAILPMDFVPEPGSMLLSAIAALYLRACLRQFAAGERGR